MDKNETNLGMLCHLLVFTGLLVPFGNFIGPLILWLIKKNELPFVEEQGRESLNFQISLALYSLVAGLLTFVMIGFVLLPIIAVAGVVLVIIASVKTSQGEHYRYPWTLRLLQ